MDLDSPHQHFSDVVTAGEVSLTHSVGAKKKQFPLGLFSPGNPVTDAEFKNFYSWAHPSASFPSAPSI